MSDDPITIDEPGVYEISAERYHADPVAAPSLSASVAWTLVSRSPLHAWAAHPRLNPDFAREDKAIFDLGSAAHNMVLRQDFWREDIDVIDAPDWRSKAAREARDAAREAGRYPILRDQHAALERMVSALERHPQASAAFRRGQPEKTLVWQDADTGAWLRARPDWMPDDRAAPWPDYKTTADALAWERRFLTDHGGLLRAALYAEGIEALAGGARPTLYYVIQEVDPPHAIIVRVMPADLLVLGRAMLRKAKSLWAACVASGEWPSYELIGTLALSKWTQERWEVDFAAWAERPAEQTLEPHEVLGA